MIYLVGWLVNYILLLTPKFALKRRYTALASLVFLGSIIICRGRVGTDTGGIYELLAGNSANKPEDVEPLFTAILSTWTHIFEIPLLAVTVGIGTTLLAILLVYVYRADPKELFLLQTFYIPAVFFEHSMNILRFGLSFAMLLVFTQSVRLRQYKLAIIAALAAIFTHYSSVVFLGFWLISTVQLKRAKTLLLASFAAPGLFALAEFAERHISQKSLIYFESGFRAPSANSGLGIAAVTAVILAAIMLGTLPRAQKVRLTIAGTLAVGAFLWVTQSSYAGLRFLGIIEVAIPYAALRLYQRADKPFGGRLRVAFLAAGLLGAILTYKHMLDETTVVRHSVSPALPYHFIWEEF